MTSRPDKESDRVGWNKSWEAEVSKLFSPSRTPLAVLDTMSKQKLDLLRATAGPHLSMDILVKTKEICILQRDLVKLAVQSFTNDELEPKWKGFTQARREELALEGLYVASCAGPDMEDRRRWCPEMSLTNLTGSGQHGFIQLLKLHLPAAEMTDELTKPVFVPNQLFESFIRVNSGDELLLKMAEDFRLSRCYFITFTLWSILNAFHGRREGIKTVPPIHRNKNVPKESWDAVKQIVGKSEARAVRRNQEKAETNLCWHCRKLEDDLLSEGKTLKACARCKAAGRVIRYCSKECQVADWKTGFPSPHKQICGKSLDDMPNPISLIPSDSKQADDDSGIPEPLPSFKRSPALLHQISLLKDEDHQHVDYVLCNPDPHPDRGVVPTHPMGRLLFLLARNKAMESGDPASVGMMYPILKTSAEQANFPLSRLRTQLLNEYGVDVDKLPPRQKMSAEEEEDVLRMYKDLTDSVE